MRVTELQIREILKRNGEAVVVSADLYRQSAVFVAGGDYRSVVTQDEYRRGTADKILGVSYAFLKAWFLIHQRGEKLRGIDLASRHRVKMSARRAEIFFNELIRVVYDARHAYAIAAEARAEQQRLRIRVAYAAYRRRALHLAENVFELRSERRVVYTVYFSLKSYFSVIRGKSAVLRTEMRMIIHSEKHVVHAIPS